MANSKEEEYEIIPHQILSDLRDEIDALKQRLQTPVGELEKELLGQMTELKSSINNLNSMVRSASEELKKEEKDGVSIHLKRLNDKIDEVSKQNEQIASALLSVANMVEKSLRKPMPMPPPRMAPPRPMAPPQGPMPPPKKPAPPPAPPGPMPPPPRPGEMPPPPPGQEYPPGAEFEHKKKGGLFGKLFKK